MCFLRQGAQISQAIKSLDALTWFLREEAQISQAIKSLDALTCFLREGAQISQAMKSLDALTCFLRYIEHLYPKPCSYNTKNSLFQTFPQLKTWNTGIPDTAANSCM